MNRLPMHAIPCLVTILRYTPPNSSKNFPNSINIINLVFSEKNRYQNNTYVCVFKPNQSEVSRVRLN
jgi:hypothetical protein